VEKLTPESADEMVNNAISESIAMCMKEPIPEGYDVTDENKQKWCAGKVYGMAREKTGKQLGQGKVQA
jgi:hypothetical protein